MTCASLLSLAINDIAGWRTIWPRDVPRNPHTELGAQSVFATPWLNQLHR